MNKTVIILLIIAFGLSESAFAQDSLSTSRGRDYLLLRETLCIENLESLNLKLTKAKDVREFICYSSVILGKTNVRWADWHRNRLGVDVKEDLGNKFLNGNVADLFGVNELEQSVALSELLLFEVTAEETRSKTASFLFSILLTSTNSLSSRWKESLVIKLGIQSNWSEYIFIYKCLIYQSSFDFLSDIMIDNYEIVNKEKLIVLFRMSLGHDDPQKFDFFVGERREDLKKTWRNGQLKWSQFIDTLMRSEREGSRTVKTVLLAVIADETTKVKEWHDYLDAKSFAVMFQAGKKNAWNLSKEQWGLVAEIGARFSEE